MSSSPVCTCCVCPTHGPAGHSADQSGHGAEQSGGGAEWAGPARRYLESVVAWLDGPEASAAGHGELEARLQVHSREQYRLLLQGHLLLSLYRLSTFHPCNGLRMRVTGQNH